MLPDGNHRLTVLVALPCRKRFSVAILQLCVGAWIAVAGPLKGGLPGSHFAQVFSTNESITFFSPACSNATVSLLPSMWVTAP